MKHLVQFSTGAASAEVAQRAVDEYGPGDVVLLSADTLVEDPDNWRFADEVATRLGCEWIILADGRTPMQVGRDEGLIPNDRWAVCSRILKRELLWAFMENHYDPADSVVYLGFDWSEPHRYTAAEPNWAPWAVKAPLMDPPYLWKPDILALWRKRGIEPPRLYERGLGHANCNGFCIRGGQAQFAIGLQVDRGGPLGYLYWEAEEEKTRCQIGKDVSILRDRIGGPVTPLTLRTHRENIESRDALFGESYDKDDFGACGCFMAEESTPAARGPRREPHRFLLSTTTDGAGIAVSCSCLPASHQPLATKERWGPGESIGAWHDLHPREADGRYASPTPEEVAA